MGYSELRNVSLSVHYRLWSILRQNGWFYTEFGVALEQKDPDNDPLVYYAPEITKPFVFMDDNWAPWPSGVKVYDKGNLLPFNRYTVDYKYNTIKLTISPSGAVTADLTVNSVNVREGHMKDEELEKAELPLIAYEVEVDENSPFCIGPGPRWRNRYVTVDIYATTDGERKDLTDNVGRFIAKIPYIDWSEHQILDEDNKLDSAFVFADQVDGDLKIVNEIRGEMLRPKQGGSEKERYRSLVTLEVERVS